MSAPPSDHTLPAPPEASPQFRRWAQRLVSPIESFLHVEASSGLLLLVAAAAALVIASSGWAAGYHHLLELPLGVRLGPLGFERPVHFWINDGLMTVFFFVVGLEIRREIHEGELATLRRAALPVAAALGGMLVPALLYLLVAGRTPGATRGWGVPMATDIAFAVGVLALLGKRVPPALRVLLLALAIIDDIGSIVVIAIFYSGPLQTSGFVILATGVVAVFVLQRLGVRRASVYVLPGLVIWAGALRSGIHPTIGGVLVGLLTPARSWLGAGGFVKVARRTADHVERALDTDEAGTISTDHLAAEAADLDLARREALSPAARLQMMLHPWVAFIVMPLFAFANAGLTIDATAARPTAIGLGVIAGLVLGKPIGILLACALAIRTRISILPAGIGWRQLPVLGLVAGIGFTMALFVAELAFTDETQLAAAKMGVLAASVIAITLGLLAGRLLLPSAPTEGATTASEAERSDEL